MLLLNSLAYFIFQHCIIRVNGQDSVLAAAVGKDLKGKFSPVLYCLGIGASFWQPWRAGAVYVAVAVAVALMWGWCPTSAWDAARSRNRPTPERRRWPQAAVSCRFGYRYATLPQESHPPNGPSTTCNCSPFSEAGKKGEQIHQHSCSPFLEAGKKGEQIHQHSCSSFFHSFKKGEQRPGCNEAWPTRQRENRNSKPIFFSPANHWRQSRILAP
ncbi:hypothetical protein [Hymenobacter rubripertinctus]|uniref:Uncharacterized protein n=1 Tax=Hymenobacter rubripertinctus TaxID=2029981 RepID=A0A418R7U7_9BACT|nr:hypothetical protein [Hymenobacter rubripertinctus]RIY13459.1 hypothetical protein D0T11_03205 [Hymenobacter rubripertinctus]